MLGFSLFLSYLLDNRTPDPTRPVRPRPTPTLRESKVTNRPSREVGLSLKTTVSPGVRTTRDGPYRKGKGGWTCGTRDRRWVALSDRSNILSFTL